MGTWGAVVEIQTPPTLQSDSVSQHRHLSNLPIYSALKPTLGTSYLQALWPVNTCGRKLTSGPSRPLVRRQVQDSGHLLPQWTGSKCTYGKKPAKKFPKVSIAREVFPGPAILLLTMVTAVNMACLLPAAQPSPDSVSRSLRAS